MRVMTIARVSAASVALYLLSVSIFFLVVYIMYITRPHEEPTIYMLVSASASVAWALIVALWLLRITIARFRALYIVNGNIVSPLISDFSIRIAEITDASIEYPPKSIMHPYNRAVVSFQTTKGVRRISTTMMVERPDEILNRVLKSLG